MPGPRRNPNEDAGQVACADKIRYETQSSARHAASTTAKRLGRRFRAYYCKYCYGWHVAAEENYQ